MLFKWIYFLPSCFSNGGDLIVIDNIEFYRNIVYLHKEKGTSYFFWIGATNRNYVWTTSNKPIIFSHFESGHFSTSKNCFVIDVQKYIGYYLWTNVDCGLMSSDNGVICMDGKKIHSFSMN